jgi:hypothetical protein
MLVLFAILESLLAHLQKTVTFWDKQPCSSPKPHPQGHLVVICGAAPLPLPYFLLLTSYFLLLTSYFPFFGHPQQNKFMWGSVGVLL